MNIQNNDALKIYINGFWDGFIDGTNEIHAQFF